jgi:hypothetical protein
VFPLLPQLWSFKEYYSLWLAEVGCAKVASANVEVVFSGAGRISMKSHSLDPQLLSD